MHRNNTTIVCMKYGNLNKFCKAKEGLNAVFKKVGLYLQNDLYLTSNSSELRTTRPKTKSAHANSAHIKLGPCQLGPSL